MTREEAIEAVKQAEDIYVHVVMAKRHEIPDGHTAIFRISKDDALAAMRELCDTDYEPNISVSENGTEVIIGKAVTTKLPENSSHFENNNGNF